MLNSCNYTEQLFLIVSVISWKGILNRHIIFLFRMCFLFKPLTHEYRIKFQLRQKAVLTPLKRDLICSHWVNWPYVELVLCLLSGESATKYHRAVCETETWRVIGSEYVEDIFDLIFCFSPVRSLLLCICWHCFEQFDGNCEYTQRPFTNLFTFLIPSLQAWLLMFYSL